MEMVNLDPGHHTSGGKSEADTSLENIGLWESKKPHERLGVSQNATLDEIKKAFLQLSRKYHPNNSNNNGVGDNEVLKSNYEEVFKLISDARDQLIARIIADSPENREKMRRDAMNLFGVSGEFLDYLEYIYRGFDQEKGQETFSEVKEIQHFIERTKIAISTMSIGIMSNDILFDMERLAQRGVSIEKLRSSIEPMVIQHCKEEADKKYWSIESFNRDVGYSLQGLEKLGIHQKDFLKKVEEKAKDIYVHGVEQRFWEGGLEFACKLAERDAENLKRFEIDPKELLPRIEDSVIKEFVREMDIFSGTNKRIDKIFSSKESKYIIDRAKESIGYITKYIGLPKEKLIASIIHIIDSKGNRLIDYL